MKLKILFRLTWRSALAWTAVFLVVRVILEILMPDPWPSALFVGAGIGAILTGAVTGQWRDLWQWRR